jgi:glycosyltransferase involved in cell wall biosynthesis
MATPTDPPLVSVITATYNSSATLKLTLSSVLQQELGDLEMWVIGDACTDDSEAVVAALSDSRVHWHNLPRNSGSQSAPNNEGLRRARGRYIAFIGHDDLWLPWHLSELVKHIEKSGADLVHSLCPLIGPKGVFEIIGPPRDGASYELHFIPPSSWLHRRELVEVIGQWQDPDRLGRGIDFDFTRRAYLAGKRIECVPTLSVLKFPSAEWGTYARKGEPPQDAFWQAMQKDPHEIVRQVLIDFTMTYARQYRQRGNVSPRIAWRDAYAAWNRFVGFSRGALLDGYGRERWPLNVIFPRRFRRVREAERHLRGLAP